MKQDIRSELFRLLDRRQFLAGAGGALLSASVVSLVGCGGASGGGSQSGTASYPLSGTVALPKGVSGAVTTMTVNTGGSSVKPAATGKFAGIGRTPEPSLAVVLTSSGGGILMGFLDPQVGNNVLSETSTAVALLYFAIGAHLSPPANKQQILTLLSQSSATTTLAATIASRLAANPNALQNGDAQISSALQTALAAIDPSSAQSQGRPQSITKISPATSALTLEQIQPSGLQSGLELLQPDDAVGFSVTNHYRRRATMYVYRVGEVSTTNVPTTYTNAVQIAGPVSIDATTSLSFFSTLTELFSGQTAFVPVTSPVQTLTLQPNTVRTNFETVIVGASALGGKPSFYGNSNYASFVGTWTSEQESLNLYAAVDVFIGIFLELLGLKVATSPPMIQACVQETVAMPTLSTMVAKAKAGDYSDAIADLIQIAASSDIVSTNLKNALKPYVLMLEHDAATAVIEKTLLQSAYRLISEAFVPVGLILGLGDLAAMAHDMAVSNQADLWTIAALKPTLTLSPATATVVGGGTVTFSVKPPTGLTGSVEYDWTQTSSFATLSASDGTVGNSIKTTSASVSVNLVTTPSDTQPITVSVTGYQIGTSGAKEQFGFAQAKVTIAAYSAQVIQSDPYTPEGQSQAIYYVYAVASFFPVAGKEMVVSAIAAGGNQIGAVLTPTMLAEAPTSTWDPSVNPSSWTSVSQNPQPYGDFPEIYLSGGYFYAMGKGLIGTILYEQPAYENELADILAIAQGVAATIQVSAAVAPTSHSYS